MPNSEQKNQLLTYLFNIQTLETLAMKNRCFINNQIPYKH